MICEPCKEAGQLNKKSLTTDGMTGGMMAQSARNGHHKCPTVTSYREGGFNNPTVVLLKSPTWCDCQHKVGKYTGESGVI